MNGHKILIVEDDFINASFITQAVTKFGCKVVGRVKRGDEALEIVKNQEVDIVFMDINIEGSMDGIICARKINEIRKMPIIYTTAYGDSATIDEASDTNLFGYLIKPFDYADVEAVLKLTIKQNFRDVEKKETNEEFTRINQHYRYYPKTQTLKRNEETVELSSRESLLFYHLFIHCNQNLSNEYLESKVWDDSSISPSTIRNTLLRLRKKIPEIKIITVSGVGYRLEGCE
ncbi:MAG: response regulator [Campylobacterota bacterium]|nr:response regulator [Campylobacterota bacterium]